MSATDTYDLIILGGGMAGLPVSIKSAHSGLQTALIEDGYLDGTCLNRGVSPRRR